MSPEGHRFHAEAGVDVSRADGLLDEYADENITSGVASLSQAPDRVDTGRDGVQTSLFSGPSEAVGADLCPTRCPSGGGILYGEYLYHLAWISPDWH